MQQLLERVVKDARTTVEGQDVNDRVKSIVMELKGKTKKLMEAVYLN
ncbi:hypothetical protein [Lachnobacterium bovis]|nr:hypothetical protein [Lachnobacterium bovis]